MPVPSAEVRPIRPPEDPRPKIIAIHAAITAAIESYPGGFEAVAQGLKKTTKRLQQEVDSLIRPGNHKASPKLSVDTAQEIMKLTDSVAPIEAMAGPGFKVIKLPPPSVQSDDPLVLLRAGLRRFGMLSILWTTSLAAEQLPALAHLLNCLGAFVSVTTNLAGEREISVNQNKALGLASMNFLCALQEIPTDTVVLELVPQMVADLSAARDLLGARVPERTRRS